MARSPKIFQGRKGGNKFKNTPDTLRSEDAVEVILGVGEGENYGLADGARSMFLGGTALVNSNGEANIEEFRLVEYTGRPDAPPLIPQLGGWSSPTAANISQLAAGTPVVRTGSLTNIDFVDFRFAIQALSRSNDKGVYPWDLQIKIEYRPTEPEGAPWKLAWTNVTPPAPGYNTGGGSGGVNIYERGPTPDEVLTPYKTFPEDNAVLYATVTEPTAVSALAGGSIQQIWINTATGQPSIYDPVDETWKTTGVTNEGTHWSYGTTSFYRNPTPPTNPSVGDVWTDPISNTTLRWNGSAWVLPLGGALGTLYNQYAPATGTNGVLSITQKISTVTVKEVRVPVERINYPYEFRVTKLSPDTSSDGKNISVVGWDSYDEIVAEAMAFPNTHIIHLLGKASDQFNALPELTGDVKGRLVDVPTNYDPITRTYSGIWDGLFKKAWTDNGAWCCRDLIKNDRYGLSALYPYEVNEAGFYRWAQWCDQPVPDNFGGSRPRWTYNDTLDTARSAKEQLEYMAGSCGAKLIDDGAGMFDVLIDMEEPMSMIFGPENVVDGEFTYGFTNIQTRANWIKVGFVNPELNWEVDWRVVKDDAHIAEFGRIPLEFVATGKTNVSEALAAARLRLAISTGEYTSVTFRTNRVGLYLRPFTVIGICDPDMGWGMSGRISSQTGAKQITLRDELYFEAGVVYKFVFNLPTSPITTFTATVASGQTGLKKVVNFNEDLPTNLPEFAYFTVESYNATTMEPMATPKAFRIVDITMAEDSQQVEIMALEINRSKWAYSDGDGELLPPVENTDLTQGMQAPTNVLLQPTVTYISGQPSRYLTLTWDLPENPLARNTIVEHSIDGNAFVKVSETTGTSYELRNPQDGVHTFRLYHQHADGARRSKQVTVAHELGGELRVVPGVSNLRLVGQATANTFDTLEAVFEWDHGTDDPSFHHYRVRLQQLVGTTWTTFRTEDATERRYAYTTDRIIADGRIRSFRIAVVKVDTFGNESPLSNPLEVSNPLVPVPSQVQIVPDIDGFLIQWASPNLRDLMGTRVYMSNDPLDLEGSAYLAQTPVYNGPSNSIRVPIETTGTYHFRLTHYDSYNPSDANPTTVLSEYAEISSSIDWGAVQEEIEDQVTAATTTLNTAVSTLEGAVDTIDGRVGTLETQVENLDDDFVSTTVYDVLRAEVETARNGSATLNAQLAAMRSATTDGLALKASASDVSNLRAEVETARNGSATLNAQLAAMRQATVDGLAGKASAEALSSLTASLAGQPNLLANSDFSDGANSWVLTGVWAVNNDAAYGTMVRSLGGPNEYSYVYQDVPVHALTDYSLGWTGDGGSAPLNMNVYVECKNAADGTIAAFGNVKFDGLHWNTRKSFTFQTPAGTSYVRVIFQKNGASTFNASFSRVMLNVGTVAMRWSNETQTRALAAKITTAQNTLVDLQNNKASATALAQLEARVVSNGNLIPNGNFEMGDATGWLLSGGTYGYNPDMGGGLCYHNMTTGGNRYPQSPLANVHSGYAGAYSAQFRLYNQGANGYLMACVLMFSDAAGTVSAGQTPWVFVGITSGIFKIENFPKPANVRSMRICLSINDATTGAVSMKQAQIEAGPVCSVYNSFSTEKDLAVKITNLQTVVAGIDPSASQTLILDVNGKISGYRINSTSTSSTFDVLVDKFRITNGSSSDSPFEFSGSTLRVKQANMGLLSAGNITVGTLTQAMTVGSGGKIIIDGANNRILITD